MIGNDAFCWSRTACGKTLASPFSVMLSAIVSSSLVYRERTFADGCPEPSFAVARTFAAGPNPVSVAVGDFNGDAKPDLAVANDANMDNISVLLGKGDGSFLAASNYSAGSNPQCVVAEDFNRDGKPDLVVSSESGVFVLLGKGDGTFQVPINSGPPGASLAAGDFNSDGKPDLAVANFGGVDLARGIPSVSVLLNTCVATDNSLDIARRNTSTAISWPLQFTQFALETATNLTLPNWRPAVEAPITNNGRLEIVVPLDRRERYFRLRKP